MKMPEILAPAGSMEALTAALRTGADAVYVGGKKFSARSSAANFSEAELEQAVYQCHIHGAKLYLAVNTVISDSETEEFCEYIKSAAKLGIDAFIVQDLGAAYIIRRAVPDAVLHASTQMSAHTAAGARMLADMGFSRIVPARELPAETLKKICAGNTETEVFVHGALCMSVSGQCYMSAMLGSRSANRGCCGQACRLPFSAAGNKDFSGLSLKDLSLLGCTERICEIGVDSLKIEGRMKRPEYAAAAVSELRKALDGGTPDMDMLRGIFSRSGFTDGYFSDKRDNMFGVREKNDVVAARDIIPKIHELYRHEKSAHTVNFHVELKSGIPLKITAYTGNISAEAEGGVPDTAKNSPTDIESLSRQLSKLGDTVFEFGRLTADIDDGLFVPAGKLNELRRILVSRLEQKIAEKNMPEYTVTGFIPEKNSKCPPEYSAKLPVRTFCRTREQAEAAAEFSEYLILPLELAESGITDSVPHEKIIIAPPRFIENEEKIISRLSSLRNNGFSHLLCHTVDSAAVGKNMGYILHGNFTMNVYNSFSAEFLHNTGFADCIISIEMTLEQLGNIRTALPLGAVVYGRLPLMLTRNCPIKNEIGCGKCTGYIADRTARKMPVACSGSYVEILNPDILFMGDRIGEIKNTAFGVVLLNDETAEETKAAVTLRKPSGNITRGLYYRGVLQNL